MTCNTWPYWTGIGGDTELRNAGRQPLWPSISITEKADLWGNSLDTDKNKNESPFVTQVNTKQKARFFKRPQEFNKVLRSHLYSWFLFVVKFSPLGNYFSGQKPPSSMRLCKKPKVSVFWLTNGCMTLKKTELKRDVGNSKVKLSRIRTRSTSRLQLTETKLWNRSIYFWKNPYRSYIYQGQQTHSKNLWITYDQLESSKKGRRFYFFLSVHLFPQMVTFLPRLS